MLAFILLAAVSLIEARPSKPVPSFQMGGMVVGGVEATPGEFPWQLSQTRSGSHSCGASLLSATQALSAAHCVDGAAVGALGIIAGLHDRSGTPGSVSVGVAVYTMHEQYNVGAATFPNDVATITFSGTIDANGGNIGYATLAPTGSTDYAGQTCVISGWGRTSASNILPNVLQKASIGVISTADCNVNLQGVGSAWDMHICLFDPAGNVGSCNGDSGGPLNCPGNIVAGVTSWGVSGGGICLQTYPSVYTRVSSYFDWINSH
jgi:pancreatic elastase II